jgi:large subunit ribosomal protein L22
MKVKAKLRHYHVAPRKVRLIIDLIRGLDVDKAFEQLSSQSKRCVPAIDKLLNSAIANAVNNFKLERDNLYIEEGFVDQGPVLKRWKPRAHGRAGRILKKTSHITLILGERVPSDDQKKKDDSTKEKKEIKTKKVDIKDIKKASGNFKGDSKLEGSDKAKGKQSKTTKSFIRKTGDK